MGNVKVLGNDPKNKKIYLEFHWSNYREQNIDEYQQFILDYNSEALKNYHLLNHGIVESVSKEDIDSEIKNIDNLIEEAIKNEYFERISTLQQKRSKLFNKLNKTL
jgi:hypothetical protein